MDWEYEMDKYIISILGVKNDASSLGIEKDFKELKVHALVMESVLLSRAEFHSFRYPAVLCLIRTIFHPSSSSLSFFPSFLLSSVWKIPSNKTTRCPPPSQSFIYIYRVECKLKILSPNPGQVGLFISDLMASPSFGAEWPPPASSWTDSTGNRNRPFIYVFPKDYLLDFLIHSRSPIWLIHRIVPAANSVYTIWVSCFNCSIV